MKKAISFMAALVMALSLFVGCAGTASSDKTVIRFATWDTAEDMKTQEALVDKFNASQDKIKVVLEAYGEEFDTKISASMGSGDAPDVMYMWDYAAYNKGLEPLDTYIEKEGAAYKENFYESLWSYNMHEGTVYGMPVGYTSHVLYFNKDIFDEAGIDYPTDEWTWEDLREASKVITEKTEGKTKGFVFRVDPDPYAFEMHLWSNGTAFCDENGKMEGYANSDEAVEVLTYFQDLEKDEYAVSADTSGSSNFSSGAVAMYVTGVWPMGNLTESGVNFGVTTIPSWSAEKESQSVLNCAGVAISKDSEQKEAAWEFVKFWTSEEANIARIGYELPVLKSVFESQKIADDPMKSIFFEMLERSEGRTSASFIMDKWSEASSDIKLAIETILNPTSFADVKETLDALAKKRDS